MKNLVLKELREHFKVALLGLGILAMMLILAFQNYGATLFRAALSRGYASTEDLQPLLSDTVLTETTFFCAIFGTLLGWLQIRAEKHPDLWAFLVHRPITRTAILRSKAISGLLLYVAGAGLPLLGLAVVVSIPGKVAAPFGWAMALPLVAIFLTGIVYYLAGLLTGLRKARWFASRGFGLGPALASSIGAFTVDEFWQALLIIVTAGVILTLAVWGSFQTNGYYRAQPALGKIALTATSFVSAVVLLGAGFSVAIDLMISRGDSSYSNYQLTKDGSVVKIIQHGLEDVEITDLKGDPLPSERAGRKLTLKEYQQKYAISAALAATVNFKDGPRRTNRYREGYRNTARFFSPWRLLDKTIWYLTTSGRLEAYHGVTRRRVDTLEPQGNIGSPDEIRFALPNGYNWSILEDYTQPEILASARTAYRIDLEKRELKPLFTVTNGDAIGGYSGGVSPSVPLKKEFAFLLTRNSIRLLNIDGKTILHRPYVPSYPSYPSVTVYWLEATNTFAVRFNPDPVLNEESGGNLLTHVEWLNADGSIRNAMDLPKLPGPQQNNFVERLALLLVPPVIPVYAWEERYHIWSVLSLVPALLCVWVGAWLGRRNDFSRKANVVWGVFHFLFGLPGLMAFLAIQEWPAKELCPDCKKLRVVSRERCEHCGAEFAPSEKTGIEIFEPLEC